MNNIKYTTQDTSALLKMIEQSKRAYFIGGYKTAQQSFSDIRNKIAARPETDVN